MGFDDNNFSDFDSSGGFGGDTDSFGDDFSFDSFSDDGFGSDNGSNDFNNNSNNFNNNSNGGFDDFGQTNNSAQPSIVAENTGASFEGAFDDSGTSDDSNKPATTKKTAIIIAIVGILVVFIALFVATKLSKSKTRETTTSSGVTIVEQPSTSNRTTEKQTNANDIMQSGNEPASNTTVVPSVTKTETDWTEIDNTQEIDFDDEYRDLMFYITGIEHKAKTSDSNLIVETVLTGSLSGMSGTYELIVPYNKGKLLSVGQEFTVKVLIGDYKGKTVVGDIKY